MKKNDFKRIPFSVPKDSTFAKWADSQNNTTASLKFLINAAIKKMGTDTDLFDYMVNSFDILNDSFPSKKVDVDNNRSFKDSTIHELSENKKSFKDRDIIKTTASRSSEEEPIKENNHISNKESSKIVSSNNDEGIMEDNHNSNNKSSKASDDFEIPGNWDPFANPNHN